MTWSLRKALGAVDLIGEIMGTPKKEPEPEYPECDCDSGCSCCSIEEVLLNKVE